MTQASQPDPDPLPRPARPSFPAQLNFSAMASTEKTAFEPIVVHITSGKRTVLNTGLTVRNPAFSPAAAAETASDVVSPAGRRQE